MSDSKQIKSTLVDLASNVNVLGDNISILEYLRNLVNGIEEKGELKEELIDLIKKMYVFNHELDKVRMNSKSLCGYMDDLTNRIK